MSGHMDDDCDYDSIMSSTSSQSYTTWSIGQPKLVEPCEKLTVEQAKARIDEIYDSGMPFFTKQAIRELWDQFQSGITAGHKIVTKDITGASLEWKVKLGQPINLIHGDKGEFEYVYKSLGVDYRTAGHLKGSFKWRNQVDSLTYTPLQLMHQLFQVDSNSENKEIVPNEEIGEREAVAQDFQKQAEAWEKSEACTKLKSILHSFASGHPINKVIGFSCGSLALPNNSHAATQTAALLTVRNWLKERDQSSDIPCYIQDPMNTQVDKEILSDIGFEVIDDPRGWLEVDERSVILSVSSNVPVKEITADIARPAIVIWDRVKDEDSDSTDPITPRVRAMMKEYDLYEFGSDGQDWENGVVIYIRKSEVPPIPNHDGTFFASKSGDQ